MATVTELVQKPSKLWVGQPLKRKEDFRLITGCGRYVDDLKLPNMAYTAFLRSPYPHAKILNINTEAAHKLPGVICILTGEDVRQMTEPFYQFVAGPAKNLKDYCMAVGIARYVGEPVAAVVAETRSICEDALELIEVEYESIPHVLDVKEALTREAPLIHKEVGTNIVFHGVWDYGNIEQSIEDADKVVKKSFYFHRFSSTPIENCAVLANFDPGSKNLTIYSNDQEPGMHMPSIATSLRIPSNRIRIVTGDIGGGFGNKVNIYPNVILVSLLSMRSGRPVKWIEERREHLLVASHGNERTFDVEIPVKKDGTIMGMKITAWDNCGAHTRTEPTGAFIWSQVTPGCYHFKNFHMDFTQVLTNKAPIGPNRGYSRMQHLWMIERSVDAVAHELGLDSSEVRLKNFIRPDEMPYVTPSGGIYDGGNYPESLRRAMKLADYWQWRSKQMQNKGSKKVIGVGLATVLQPGTPNAGQGRIANPEAQTSGHSEGALVFIDAMGQITAAMGTVPQGQGHETFASQVVADELGVSPEKVVVLIGFDTATTPYTPYSGAYASRSAVSGTGALLGAAKKIKDKASKIASHLMKVENASIVFREGCAVDLNSGRKVSWQQIAHTAWRNYAVLPRGMEPGLIAIHYWNPPDFTFPDEKWRFNQSLTYAYHSHVAVVELDLETGKLEILKYAIVDDCGRQINPMIVEGQVHGATAHGIGAAMYESFEYNKETGQLESSTFVDYLVPTSLEIPELITDSIENLSLFAPLGIKGVGEGGGTPLAAISNAVQDAVFPFGVHISDSHQNPFRIYEMIKSKYPIDFNLPDAASNDKAIRSVMT